MTKLRKIFGNAMKMSLIVTEKVVKKVAGQGTGKPMGYNDDLYSDEHKRRFKANDVTAQVGRLEGKLVLAINGANIGEWFKEQFERLRKRIKLRSENKKGAGLKF